MAKSLLTPVREMLEANGFAVDTVERTIPNARTTKDLFGIFDLLAVKRTATVGIQVTDFSNIAARRKKIDAAPITPIWLAGNEIWLIGVKTPDRELIKVYDYQLGGGDICVSRRIFMGRASAFNIDQA